MMTDWPSARFIRSARMRPSVSVGPPAGNGTTIEIGRDGKVSAPARAIRDAVGNTAAPAKRRSNRRRASFMTLPHELQCLPANAEGFRAKVARSRIGFGLLARRRHYRCL